LFSIYIHIPYCPYKCPYCDFAVVALRHWPEERYAAALATELRNAAADSHWTGREVGSVYFGGGTPSLFAAESIARLMAEVHHGWRVGDGAEVTLEANPGTIDEPRVRGYAAAGVNRISLGVESFEARHLKTLGRGHTPADNEDAVRAIKAAGVDNINVDLIFAIPGQTLAEWDADLARALALGPSHISAYNLTYEERTAFFRWRAQGKLVAAANDLEAEMFTLAQDRLGAGGLQQYEISNYCRPGRWSRHNTEYWNGGEYLGVGAGAHSYQRSGWGRRWSNQRNHLRYMAAIEGRGEARAFAEDLSRQEARTEAVFLGLRQRRGVDDRVFAARFGRGFAAEFPQVAALCAGGLLTATPEGYALTDRGLLVADSVLGALA
jgi:oxygen-independent coproporphyrinogen-3 oxidase